MKYCKNCGKELFDEAVVCPGCGCSTAAQPTQPAQPGQPAAYVPNAPGMGQAPVGYVPKSARQAQIFGILAVVLLFPLGIPAIVLANKSKAETNGVMCGKAKAGFICGIVALSVWALNMLLLFV